MNPVFVEPKGAERSSLSAAKSNRLPSKTEYDLSFNSFVFDTRFSLTGSLVGAVGPGSAWGRSWTEQLGACWLWRKTTMGLKMENIKKHTEVSLLICIIICGITCGLYGNMVTYALYYCCDF